MKQLVYVPPDVSLFTGYSACLPPPICCHPSRRLHRTLLPSLLRWMTFSSTRPLRRRGTRDWQVRGGRAMS